MRQDLSWFQERASQTWRAQPGRSLLALVPVGCDERQAARAIAEWVPGAFPLPSAYQDHALVAVRLVGDQTQGSAALLTAIEAAFKKQRPELRFETAVDPAERLTNLVEALHELNAYPILLIERFHALARLADDKFMAVLSGLRTLEHDGALTTIALSPIGYDVIRRRLAATLPFVNSAYGDCHDRAVMRPLGFAEFATAARRAGLGEELSSSLFELGGGPDVVYSALIDEMPEGLDGIESRCVSRVGEHLYRFLDNAVGDWSECQVLMERLAMRRCVAADRAFLASLPHAGFVLRYDAGTPVLAGAVLQEAVRARLGAVLPPVPRKSSQAGSDALNIVFVAADPDLNLDLSEEMRSVQVAIGQSALRESVTVQCAVSARPEDLIVQLRQGGPNALHFSGHGSKGILYLRDDGDGETAVAGEDLAEVLDQRGVRLIIINACWSATYADALARVAEVVICTTEAVGDDAARRFSAMFYRALGDGYTVAEAFRDATDAVRLRGLNDVYRMYGEGAFRFGPAAHRSKKTPERISS